MSASAKTRGQLRIIGGQWRGRKLRFPEIEGLRPTTDRVRETLFNWLAPHVHGARCLDLFAGSGALGLEALSRGAAFCDFIDCSRPAVAQIRGHLQTLRAVDRGSCNQQSAGDYLTGNTQRWDIVFIDPPFGKGMVAPCCELLEHNNALQPGAMVYIETAVDETDAGIPQHWALHRHKCAGGVSYQLFVVPIA